MRSEQANARFIATYKRPSLQASSALRIVSASQISRFLPRTFGTMALSNGFRAMSSQRTACLNAQRRSLIILPMLASVSRFVVGLRVLVETECVF